MLESELIRYAKIVESQSVEIGGIKQTLVSQQNEIEELKSTNAELLRDHASQKSLLKRLLKNTKSNFENSKYRFIPAGETDIAVPVERGTLLYTCHIGFKGIKKYDVEYIFISVFVYIL